MSSPAFTAVAVALVVGMVGVLGCSTGDAQTGKDPIASTESELRLSSPRYLGQIANGETKSVPYFDPPPYRAFGFSAKAGDQITVDVKSMNGGDALAWITTSAFDVLAANDDASATTLDAKVVYKVPANAAPRAYRIVFRDYDLDNATFNVTLTVTSPTVTCTYNGEPHMGGTSFPATDGCNTCSCTATGGVSCTRAVCACDPAKEPWRDYIGTPETCGTIIITCTPDRRRFQNPCGCGCELLVH